MFDHIYMSLPPEVPGGFLRYWLDLYPLHLHHHLKYLWIKIRV
jgi:hypothetical protein